MKFYGSTDGIPMDTESIFTAELEFEHDALLGEGPVWDWRARKLYWVDIEGFAVHRYDPETRNHKIIDVGQYVGSVAIRRSGGLIAALKSGFASLDPDTGEIEKIAEIGRASCRERVWV